MVLCLYFHIFVGLLNTIVRSALSKRRLCKNLISKSFLSSAICMRSSSNQFVVALYYLQIWLRNLCLRFKRSEFWLRNLQLRFKLLVAEYQHAMLR